MAVQLDGAPHQIGVRVKLLAPVTVAEHDGIGGIQGGVHAQGREVVVRYHTHIDEVGFAVNGDTGGPVGLGNNVGKGSRMGSQELPIAVLEVAAIG